MFKKTIIAGLSILALAFAGTVFAAGAENIVLKGGHMGDVHFPHKVHQDTLKDCKACHSTFPMKKDAIQDAIANGKLKKKEVMKDLCEKCHKERKAKGEKTGPTTCKSCHTK